MNSNNDSISTIAGIVAIFLIVILLVGLIPHFGNLTDSMFGDLDENKSTVSSGSGSNNSGDTSSGGGSGDTSGGDTSSGGGSGDTSSGGNGDDNEGEKPHEHNFVYGEWYSDNNSHYRQGECECGMRTTEAGAHNFDGDTCTDCGYKKTD